jgi:hypothetical protein
MSKSRVSQKSQLTPSSTKGSNAINLGKDSGGVEMGRKAQPSLTSGEIGVTQEVANIGGLSVIVGGNIDISPIDFGININPSEGTLAIATGAEIPGGLIGLSGGIEINTNTGQVIGGSVGAEALGLGINVSNSSKGGLGIEFTVQIPGTPIELSLGFGFPPPKPTPTPTPTPSPSSSPTPSSGGAVENPSPFPPGSLPTSGGSQSCAVIVVRKYKEWGQYLGRVVTFFHSESKGLAQKDNRGFLRISGSFYTVRNWSEDKGEEPLPAPSDFANLVPPWQRGTLVDSFSYGGFYGASGSEGQVYKDINTFNQIFFTDSRRIIAVSYEVVYSDCPLSRTPPPEENPSSPSKTTPFPNPPPTKRNMDECCRESTKLLRQIHTRLGISKFPGQLPATIIQETLKKGEQPAEPPQVPIADFVDLLNWQFGRDDERWGQWEVQINVKDADITQEGDQGKQIRFPNLAESLAEVEGQLLSIMTNVDALVALSVRNLSESGLARQEAVKGYLASMAIAKYMAFPYTEIDVEIPSTYTPGATSIDKLIIESVIHAKGIDYENKETLRDVFLDLLQAAAITRAVHWRQVDPKSDVKKQILSQLEGSAELSEKITNVKAVSVDGEAKDKKESWEDKLDQYENGYGFATGIEDANTPYGRDRERRPRIRQIGDNIAQAGKNE